MSEALERITKQEYKYGFVTDIEQEFLPPGLDEDVIRHLSAKKQEPAWMTEWRLKAYRQWLTMVEPRWPKLHHAPIDYQSISYYAAPKKRPGSLDEVDPKLLATYEKLGIPLDERMALAGVVHDGRGLRRHMRRRAHPRLHRQRKPVMAVHAARSRLQV